MLTVLSGILYRFRRLRRRLCHDRLRLPVQFVSIRRHRFSSSWLRRLCLWSSHRSCRPDCCQRGLRLCRYRCSGFYYCRFQFRGSNYDFCCVSRVHCYSVKYRSYDLCLPPSCTLSNCYCCYDPCTVRFWYHNWHRHWWLRYCCSVHWGSVACCRITWWCHGCSFIRYGGSVKLQATYQWH